MNNVSLRNTFTILFFIKRNKKNNKEEHPIYCRLTIQGKSREFATQIWIRDLIWNPSPAKILGNNELAKTGNNALSSIRNNLFNIRTILESQGKLISPENVINVHFGKFEKRRTLIEIHKYYNEEHIKKLIGNGYALGTYQRFKTSLEHTIKFMRYQYHKDDVFISDMNLSFATNYEFFLKSVRNCANNTAVKYIKNLKTVINYAIKQGWSINNPIEQYLIKLTRVEKDYLTHLEIELIATKKLGNKRLEEVRDIFVFCCYTGLAYADIAKLDDSHILIGITGVKEINIKRTKTDSLAKIPLIDQALLILTKYRNNEHYLTTKKIFPVKSNQKQNAYLKEIANLSGCSKKLTTHTARHTFATLMLTNGMSIESVSKMLGHANIKTTQIYANVTGEKIANEMNQVNEKFKQVANGR